MNTILYIFIIRAVTEQIMSSKQIQILGAVLILDSDDSLVMDFSFLFFFSSRYTRCLIENEVHIKAGIP